VPGRQDPKETLFIPDDPRRIGRLNTIIIVQHLNIEIWKLSVTDPGCQEQRKQETNAQVRQQTHLNLRDMDTFDRLQILQFKKLILKPFSKLTVFVSIWHHYPGSLTYAPATCSRRRGEIVYRQIPFVHPAYFSLCHNLLSG
jgi:hypothetical protein